MVFPKTLASGSALSYTAAATWDAISIRNAAYSWTLSGSGTNEYFARTAANGNPGFVAAPDAVYINGSAASSGSVGSLTAGRYGFGDNDSLGYSTVYVRLSDGTDPDSKSADYITFKQYPRAGEDVTFPAAGGTLTTNLDQSSVAIADFVTEPLWQGQAGTASSYLRIDPDTFTWAGGTGYIDLTTAAIKLRILGTAGASPGYRGLNLRGGGTTSEVDISGGTVGLAAQLGQTMTITTLRVNGSQADVWIGDGCALTTLDHHAGTTALRCSAAVTTVNMYGGRLVLEEGTAASNQATTINLYGGEIWWMSRGNVGTLNQYGGMWDELRSGYARTLATWNYHGGQFRINKEAVTHTNGLAFGRSVTVAGNTAS